MKEILNKYSIKLSKRLGQNFLIDKNVLKKIIEAAKLSPQDTLLEIGPGLGILTLELAKKVKQVIAVEKDKKMCEILKENLKNYKNIEIINQDILKIKSSFFHDREKKLTDYKLVANLPYYITSPVIRKFLECDEARPRHMILMVQKEVAQRICAKPPHMNLLAVAVQFYAQPEIISYVSKNSFWPQPKVDSAIIKIVPNGFWHYLRAGYEPERAWSPAFGGGSESESLNEPRWDSRRKREDRCQRPEIKQFFNLVKIGFSSKRKMLKNNLKIDESILKKIGLNPKIRAENLSIEDWLRLYEML